MMNEKEKIKVAEQVIEFIDELEKVCKKHKLSFYSSISNGMEELIINDFDNYDIQNLKTESFVCIYNNNRFPIAESIDITRLVSEYYKNKQKR